MKKVLTVLIFVCFTSCKSKSGFENQIRKDLIGMLMNKVEVKEVLISDISKIDENTQMITFDCKLFFTDDLYTDNGILAFKKGMKIKEIGNKFYYNANGNDQKLVKLEFGKTDIENQQ